MKGEMQTVGQALQQTRASTVLTDIKSSISFLYFSFSNCAYHIVSYHITSYLVFLRASDLTQMSVLHLAVKLFLPFGADLLFFINLLAL